MTPIHERASHPTSGHPWTPESESEKAAVREQLERLLSNSLFRNSKRYPALLRYVVERVLDGRKESVKERTLGIEVFHREPDYDTNQDPVVRTTAVEVRRRLTQYYQEPGREREIRIEFHAGSYTPEIRMPEEVPAPAVEAVPEPPKSQPAYLVFAATAVLAILTVATYGLSRSSQGNSLDRFWSPVWESPDPVLVCVEGIDQPSPAGATASAGGLFPAIEEPGHVSFDDVTAVARILGQKPDRSRSFRIRPDISTKFEDLREGPVVLVGGFSNRWTMRLMEHLKLRFHLKRTPDLAWIEDRQNPGQKSWSVDLRVPPRELIEDYALVSRVRDSSTGQVAVVAAGLLHYGTSAAGEFLSNPKYLAEALKGASGNAEGKNIEVVLSTRLTDGNPGPPQIRTAYFW